MKMTHRRPAAPLVAGRFPFPMWMTRLPLARPEWGKPDLISQEQASYTLGISRTTLWRLIKASEIEGIAIGSRTLISRASIEAYIEKHSTRGSEQ